MPFGKCIDCVYWIKSDPEPKKCTCKKKEAYYTLNALKRAYCESYYGKQKIIENGYTFIKLKVSLLFLIVCTNATNSALITSTVNNHWHPGTSQGWSLAEGETLNEIGQQQTNDQLKAHMTNPIECQDLANHKHWIFVC